MRAGLGARGAAAALIRVDSDAHAMASSIARAQVPAPGGLNVDHVAHFVPRMDGAGSALERLGFTLTPFSVQSHRLSPGGPLQPAGAANRCVMLQRGYLEFLTPTGDTPVASQLRAAIERYVGVHLIAFGSAAAAQDHTRLAAAGFAPLAPLALQRRIGTEAGEQTARFAVVRVPPGTMAEGRIQFCHHLTPQWLWQDRWTQHANHAVALKGVILCVADPGEAAARYARFTGLSRGTADGSTHLATARGYLRFADAARVRRRLGVQPPRLPWIAGYILESGDLGATAEHLHAAGVAPRMLQAQRLLIELPEALGGLVIFEAADAAMLDF